MIIIERCKREEYILAWKAMYKFNKKIYNDPEGIYEGVNPALNKKPLNSELDNFCVVAYDNEKECEGFKYGRPVGIFSFVITPSKIIGKQYVVDPEYTRKGIGKALLLENEKTLLDNGYDHYYIGCSHCSAGIMKSFGRIPYNEDDLHDMYKFNIENLGSKEWKELYNKYLEGFIVKEK